MERQILHSLQAEFIRLQGQAKRILGSNQVSKGILMAVCALVPKGCEQNNKTNEIAEGVGGLGVR